MQREMTEDQLKARVAELERVLSHTIQKPFGPEVCPFTGRSFWGNIEHPELGIVATYGGPFDTYTLPERDSEDQSFHFHRYDHDAGSWTEGVHSLGAMLVDDQLYTSKDDPAEMAAERDRLRAEVEALRVKINTPHTKNFAEAVVLEAVHQRDRWGSAHDAGKAPEDWFWLLGYLSGKALHAAKAGDTEKALHHTISSAAALANWHAALSGASTDMRPGIDPVARDIENAAIAAQAKEARSD